MKISALFLAFVAANDEDRKVPPRTPLQRLNTLHRFANEWVQAEIAGTINRPQRSANMIDNGIARIVAKMEEAYAKDCAYFNPNVPHGGPRPAEESQRKRRWVEEELARVQRDADRDNVDIFDEIFEAQANGERTVNLRLSSEPNLAWKQIGTGYRKWILRYISECSGQRVYSYHTNRLAKIHTNIKTAYDTVGNDGNEGDYGNEEYNGQ